MLMRSGNGEARSAHELPNELVASRWGMASHQATKQRQSLRRSRWNLRGVCGSDGGNYTVKRIRVLISDSLRVCATTPPPSRLPAALLFPSTVSTTIVSL